jgi:hypothetical protein
MADADSLEATTARLVMSLLDNVRPAAWAAAEGKNN